MSSTSIEKSLAAIEARLSLIENSLNKANHQSQSLLVNKKRNKTSPKPMSGNWLGIVASVCFILAAGFIVKLSIVSGWLTHEKQLGLATLFGLALFTAGILISSADKVYASFLPAAGATILYITCLAAYQYYLLISFQTVIAITSIISGLSIWFYIRFKHDIYAIIAAIGAYVAPVVSNVDGNAIFSLYYFIICSLTFATLSIWVQSRTLTVIAAYLAISTTAWVGLNLDQDGLIAIALALNFLIFSIGSYFHTHLTHQELTEKESWSLFPVLLIFYAMEYYFIGRIEPALAPWVSLAVAGILVGLYLSAKRWQPNRQFNSYNMILTFVTVVFFHSVYLTLLPAVVKPWLFVIIVLGYGLSHSRIYLKKANASLIVPIVALSAILGIEYLSIMSHLVGRFALSWAIVSWASFASIWFAFLRHQQDLAQKDEYSYALLAAAHLLCIMGLYQITINYGSLAVSSSWLFYALIVLGFSFVRNDIIMAKSVLVVLSFAAGKALIYDASSTPTIIRTLCLILTGVVLYASGLVIRKMTQWKSKVH
ncbi:DUF2339 domain-containing protein [Legionella maioricensis]|uniref:DUF2339 domain-containing protein n=1 Tax=Legionella maioricensis TaxID=2896528 RepID=A0A9X2IC88_9GAMM|nr:DUF2339 domain-containing protein [Legionella maioricensis]MCL9685669.1 DUF2339 domain-containing protein [Legionella maioricensis]MCL9689065.1 DUF2339 domain-containing protein [Legionella maioricensis]